MGVASDQPQLASVERAAAVVPGYWVERRFLSGFLLLDAPRIASLYARAIQNGRVARWIWRPDCMADA